MQAPDAKLPDKRSALLVTPRLTLRPLAAEDSAELHALLVQPGVRRRLCDDRALTLAEVEAMVATSLRRHADAGTGLWALMRNARPGLLAGCVGLWRYERDTATEAPEELVFALCETHWGSGYALEGGTALLAHARDALGWYQACASTDLGNNASIRTLWRLGFVEAGLAQGPNGALRRFRRVL